MAVSLILQLLDDESCADRLVLHEFEAVCFLETADSGNYAFPLAPSAFSLFAMGGMDHKDLPKQCPALTPFTFDPADTPKSKMPVWVALGYTSQAAEDSTYKEMAAHFAGTFKGDTMGCATY